MYFLRCAPTSLPWLARAGFEILNEVVLNQVLVSFGDADRTKERLLERLASVRAVVEAAPP